MSDSVRQFRIAAALVGFAIPVVACNGAIGHHGSGSATGTGGAGTIVGPGVLGGKSPEEVLASCAAPSPGRSPLRRLSNTEYRNTIGDLFANVPAVVALIPAATSGFPSEPESLGFRNSGDYLTVPSLAAQKYLDAAEQIAETAANASNFVTCANGTQDAACATSFINSFGKQVYRRPLAADDTARYRGLYRQGDLQRLRLQDGHRVDRLRDAAIAAVPLPVRARVDAHGQLRQAHATRDRVPPLLHLPAEHAGRGAARGRRRRRAGDAGADRGAGAAPAGRSQGRAPPRLLRAVARHRHAARHRAGRDGLPEPRLRRCRRCSQGETRAFAADLLTSPTGTFEALFTAPYTFANAALARHYGLTGPTGSTYEKVDAPGRAGVLTQGMMLAHDKATRTSIVRRGLKIRTDVLCQIVPAPPPDVDLSSLDKTATGVSQRERLEQHRTVASCANCHVLMDPIGVVFEGFDAVGRARTMDELGLPVVLASELSGTRDADGPVANPTELGQKLAQSQQVRELLRHQQLPLLLRA